MAGLDIARELLEEARVLGPLARDWLKRRDHVLGVPLGQQLVIGQDEVAILLQTGLLFHFILQVDSR